MLRQIYAWAHEDSIKSLKPLDRGARLEAFQADYILAG